MRSHCKQRAATRLSTPLRQRVTITGLAALAFVILGCSDPTNPQRPGNEPEFNPPRDLNDPVLYRPS